MLDIEAIRRRRLVRRSYAKGLPQQLRAGRGRLARSGTPRRVTAPGDDRVGGHTWRPRRAPGDVRPGRPIRAGTGARGPTWAASCGALERRTAGRAGSRPRGSRIEAGAGFLGIDASPTWPPEQCAQAPRAAPCESRATWVLARSLRKVTRDQVATRLIKADEL